MRVRVSLARGLLRLGAFIQSLPVVVMRPDDLVEFSRQSYARPRTVDELGRGCDRGFRPDRRGA